MTRHLLLRLVTGGIVVATAIQCGLTQTGVPGVEFFEKKVRPLLVEECFSCHSAASKPLMGGLRLDSRPTFFKGGSRGALIDSRQPDASLLLKAVRYTDPSIKMPPRGRLSPAKIAILEQWVRQGASIPEDRIAPSAGKAPPDIMARARHWSFQPVHAVVPPWSGVQAFPEETPGLLRSGRLGVSRRDSGTPSEQARVLGGQKSKIQNPKSDIRNPIDAFVGAKLMAAGVKPASPADRRTLIRRVTFDLTGLPPTPQEIDSFLADRSLNAWAKVVDRLLASPRYGERWARHWLDLVRYAETDGHEFDTDKPGAFEYRDYVIRALNADVPFDQFVKEHVAGDLLPRPRIDPATGINESIIGTACWYLGEAAHSPVDLLVDEAERVDNQIDVFGKAFLGLTIGCARCHDHKFDPIPTKDYYALAGYLRSTGYQIASIEPPEPRLIARREIVRMNSQIAKILFPEYPAYRQRRLADEEMRSRLWADSHTTQLVNFAMPDFGNWKATGEAFGGAPVSVGILRWDAEGRIAGYSWHPAADSGAISARLQGALRSPTFIIEKPKILYRMAGHGCRVRLIVDGFQRIRDPIYGGLEIAVEGSARWYTQDVSKWIGRRAYVEIVDNGPGWIAVEEIRLGTEAIPQYVEEQSETVARLNAEIARNPELAKLVDQRRQIELGISGSRRVFAMVDGSGWNDRVQIRGNPANTGDLVQRRFLRVCGGDKMVAPPSDQGSGRLALAERMLSESNPLLARVIVNRLWQHHFGEGLVRTPDDFGLRGAKPTHPELLDWLAAKFVEGEMGRGGEGEKRQSEIRNPKSEISFLSPPLNWSLKKLHRLILLSNAYRTSSQVDAAAEKADPQNKLLHRMTVRRLEAEAIRDSILAVSGRLDIMMYGPGVMPYLTPFMEGRGRPDASGPMDGAGRRSVYLGVRRNFLNPFFLAFDFPVPFNTTGRRSVSNVPAQALTLMNNPFVLEQAGLWARRVVAEHGLTDEQRIDRMYIMAFARPPTSQERVAALTFLAEQRKVNRTSDEVKPWADLCHVLYNVKEFIFVE